MWQKCCICNGTGLILKDYFENNCKTCDGKGIISELTGLPPNNIYKTPQKNSGDFRDNCEQFENK